MEFGTERVLGWVGGDPGVCVGRISFAFVGLFACTSDFLAFRLVGELRFFDKCHCRTAHYCSSRMGKYFLENYEVGIS